MWCYCCKSEVRRCRLGRYSVDRGVVGARVDSVFAIGDKVEGRIGPAVAAAAAIGEIVGVVGKNVGVSATREGDKMMF